MESRYFRNHIANFYLCNYCEHKNKAENEEPCYDCLYYPGDLPTRRPIHFKDNGSLAKLLKELSKGE